MQTVLRSEQGEGRAQQQLAGGACASKWEKGRALTMKNQSHAARQMFPPNARWPRSPECWSRTGRHHRTNLHRMREQACLTAWRVIRDWLEAQLAMTQAVLVSMAEIFLPTPRTPNGRDSLRWTRALSIEPRWQDNLRVRAWWPQCHLYQASSIALARNRAGARQMSPSSTPKAPPLKNRRRVIDQSNGAPAKSNRSMRFRVVTFLKPSSRHSHAIRSQFSTLCLARTTRLAPSDFSKLAQPTWAQSANFSPSENPELSPGQIEHDLNRVLWNLISYETVTPLSGRRTSNSNFRYEKP